MKNHLCLTLSALASTKSSINCLIYEAYSLTFNYEIVNAFCISITKNTFKFYPHKKNENKILYRNDKEIKHIRILSLSANILFYHVYHQITWAYLLSLFYVLRNIKWTIGCYMKFIAHIWPISFEPKKLLKPLDFVLKSFNKKKIV